MGAVAGSMGAFANGSMGAIIALMGTVVGSIGAVVSSMGAFVGLMGVVVGGLMGAAVGLWAQGAIKGMCIGGGSSTKALSRLLVEEITLNNLSMKKSSIGGNKYLEFLWERTSSRTTFRWCWGCMGARSGDGLSIPGNLGIYNGGGNSNGNVEGNWDGNGCGCSGGQEYGRRLGQHHY
jgi:hypothetical protein